MVAERNISMTREEQIFKLFEAVAELLVKKARELVPETGSFQKVCIEGHYSGTDCHSYLSIENSHRSETERQVTLGVFREGYDKLVSNYLYTGTRQEVLSWLESREGLKQIIKAYEHLEEKAKDW